MATRVPLPTAHRRWRRVGFAAIVAVMATAVSIGSPASGSVTHAVFTTVNTGVDGPDHCQQSANNCNLYDGKEFVWLNGGPNAAQLDVGTYFFAVLDPGGQRNANDGSGGNLSDGTDLYTDRTFSVTDTGANYAIVYSGLHKVDSNLIRVGVSPAVVSGGPDWYQTTSNNGGVYILAVCRIDDNPSFDSGTDTYDASKNPVSSKNCKYDAFKVNSPNTTPPAQDLTVSKDATPSFVRTYPWTVTKGVDNTEIDQSTTSAVFNYTVTATPGAAVDSGWQVAGKITVTNPNDFAVAADVTDALSDGTQCAVTGGSGATIPANDHQDFAYTCTYSSAPASNSLTNVATATWDASYGTPNASASNDPPTPVTFDDGSLGNPSVKDFCATITDQLGLNPANTLGDVCVDGTATGVPVGVTEKYDSGVFTFTYSRTLTSTAGHCTTYNNTAESTGDDTGAQDTDGASAKLCVGADLTASKGATPTFTRTYNWTINKAVDKTLIRQNGGTATFNYTVTVNSGSPAYTDSGWQIAGAITVSNPNDWEAVTVDISDAVNDGGVCVVTNGAGVSVPAASGGTAGQASRSYTCTWSSAPTVVTTPTNTATVMWDSGAATTPHGSTTGTATFSFATPTTEVHKTITVTDPAYSGGTPPGTLGTVTYGVTPLPKQFTYSHGVPIDPNQCATYNNTATIADTGQTSSRSVRACPTVTGLTMGYWQNKNGQGRITALSASGCQALYNYLVGFIPFTVPIAGVSGITSSPPYGLACGTSAGLTGKATASAGIAGYVYDVIKAANAGNATMAAMLRAQMLVTALNVSFSVTNANEKIDLVNGCKMIDSSTGTGTCNGSENWSPAFNNQTTMTVSAMLTWVAGQYNLNGTPTVYSDDTWYPSNSKTLQGLAKDAFDAINNSVALAGGP